MNAQASSHPDPATATAPGVLPHPSTLSNAGTPGSHTSSSESPPAGQHQYSSNPYSSFTTDDEFWATLALNSPDNINSATTASSAAPSNTLDSAFDALPPGTFAPAVDSLSQPAGNAEADFFAQDIEQILAEATNVAPSTWQQLDSISQIQAPASNYNLDLGGFSQSAYNTQLFPAQAQQQQPYAGSVHGSAYGFNTTGSAFNFPRAVPTFSVYSGHDEQHSVYSETSAYLSNTGHPALFQNPSSPTYQINTLPEELDMSHFALSASRSAYGGTNLSSVAPSSLVNASILPNGNIMPGEESGEKKHQCPHCPRAFARAYNLKTHIATHDPQRPKPYKCPYASCGRGFSRKHDLGRHVGSVHEKGAGSERGGASERGGTMSERGGSGELGQNGNGVEKVWCDGCGRGWVKGHKSGCVCDEADREMGRVKWEDTK
ncbi:hypothetical protein CALVIDRAFT_213756 [Calocera viscosa TUFC12733]|uniref:C2H2-type domain-containing protein n=1 Tax=Calocera viscosa (strain TUFC12733) TaxID=1330018 RepID=A0A167RDM0_CALVF|nr:hypothetical protein CALVIDRAFT_213756 [Calocera viscosa TUFC12733]